MATATYRCCPQVAIPDDVCDQGCNRHATDEPQNRRKWHARTACPFTLSSCHPTRQVGAQPRAPSSVFRVEGKSRDLEPQPSLVIEMEFGRARGGCHRLMVRDLSFVALLAISACGPGVPVVPDGRPVSYADHVEPLIIKRCLGCHTAEEPKEELVLERGQGYAQLVERASEQVPSMELVVPGDADTSYLWHKVDHTASHGKGMPRTLTGAKRLPPAELELIRRWIEDGAKP